MKCITAIFCAALLAASLTSCTKNDVPMTRAGDRPKLVLLSMIDSNGEASVRPSYPPGAKTVPYRMANYTDEACHIVLIPKLERNLGLQFEDKWEEVPFKDGIGFCGTPDTIDGGEVYDGEVDLSNFNDLPTGCYRLSFESFDKTNVMSAEFILQNDKKADGEITLTQLLGANAEHTKKITLSMNGTTVTANVRKFYAIADSIMLTSQLEAKQAEQVGLFITAEKTDGTFEYAYITASGEADKYSPLMSRLPCAMYIANDTEMLAGLFANIASISD